MRVGVYLIRFAVSRPPGVTDTGRPFKAGGFLLQLTYLAGVLIHRNAIGADRYTAGVIAPVLQPEQAVEQDRLGLPVANITNNTAHN